MASWRGKTNTNYNSAWRKWSQWCSERNKNPISADIATALGFLADQFDKGKQYRSINCYRSAISSTHLPVQGFPLGQHPLVCRLLKGVFNSRPPQPRYKQTWEVAQVLKFLKEQGPNEKLSLKDLTHKLAMLLALVLAHRCSDLVRLSLQGRRYTPEGVSLIPRGVAKQSAPGREKALQPIWIPVFPEDQLLCPVSCLSAYEKATESFRGQGTDCLFIATVSPHKPVVSSTIARWLKQVLKGSGVDTTVFKAHSTRGASSTAAALAGISSQEIMDQVGWSRQSTFCRFYYRPPREARSATSFGQAVLKNTD